MPPKQAKKKKQPQRKKKTVRLLETKKTVTRRMAPAVLSRSIPSAIQPQYPRTYATITGYKESKLGLKDAVLIKYGGPVIIGSSTAVAGSTTSAGVYNTVYSTSNTGTATAGLEVNPWFLIPHGSSAEAAFAYSRFMYRKLKFTWVGTIATNANAAVALQYTPDGSASPSDYPFYTDAAQSQCHMFVPAWSTMTMDCTPFLNTKDMYYVDWDTGGGDAGARQCFQGIATWKASPAYLINAVAGDFGVLYVEAELICAEATRFLQDFAITARKPRPRDRMKTASEPGSPPVIIEKPRRSESKARDKRD